MGGDEATTETGAPLGMPAGVAPDMAAPTSGTSGPRVLVRDDAKHRHFWENVRGLLLALYVLTVLMTVGALAEMMGYFFASVTIWVVIATVLALANSAYFLIVRRLTLSHVQGSPHMNPLLKLSQQLLVHTLMAAIILVTFTLALGDVVDAIENRSSGNVADVRWIAVMTAFVVLFVPTLQTAIASWYLRETRVFMHNVAVAGGTGYTVTEGTSASGGTYMSAADVSAVTAPKLSYAPQNGDPPANVYEQALGAMPGTARPGVSGGVGAKRLVV